MERVFRRWKALGSGSDVIQTAFGSLCDNLSKDVQYLQKFYQNCHDSGPGVIFPYMDRFFHRWKAHGSGRDVIQMAFGSPCDDLSNDI